MKAGPIAVTVTSGLGAAFLLGAAIFSPARIQDWLGIAGENPTRLFLGLVIGLQLSLLAIGAFILLRRPKLNLAGLAISAITVALGIGALTWTVQKLYPLKPVVSGWRTYATRSEQNQLHFRGRPICYDSSDFVVVILGDSQVEATALDFEQMPERRLEHHLRKTHPRTRVFSVGARGYGQDQQLLGLRDYFSRYRADLVVLWQTPQNDVWNNVFPSHCPRHGAPKPTFHVVDGKLSEPSEAIGEPIEQSDIKLIALCQRAFAPERYYRRDDKWKQFLPREYSPMPGWHGEINYERQKTWDSGIDRDDGLLIEKGSWSMEHVPPSPRLEYGVQLTRLLLEEIRTLTRANNCELSLFHALVPEDRGEREETCIFNGQYYRNSKAQLARNIQRINEGFDSFPVDVIAINYWVSEIDHHLNTESNDQVMADAAKALSPRVARINLRREAQLLAEVESLRAAKSTTAAASQSQPHLQIVSGNP